MHINNLHKILLMILMSSVMTSCSNLGSARKIKDYPLSVPPVIKKEHPDIYEKLGNKKNSRKQSDVNSNNKSK